MSTAVLTYEAAPAAYNQQFGLNIAGHVWQYKLVTSDATGLNIASGPAILGGIYGFECDAFIESLDGQELGVGAYWLARLWAYEATNTGKLAITHSYNAFNRYPDKRNDMHLILPPWQADRVGTAMGSSSNLRIQFGGRTDGSQAFRAGVSTPRFVRIA